MILVTGGTGLVGAHLLAALTQTETKVRAIYRRAHKIDLVKQLFNDLPQVTLTHYQRIEWVEANINNIPQLQVAFKDISYVYHCAAFVSFEPDKYKVLRKINIEGTANVVNLCISNQIKKLCHVSSIAAIGKELNPKTYITEKTVWNTEDDHNVYAITKYGAEMEVWRGSQEGLDVVIVNPGVIIGGGFWKSGSSGSLFYKMSKGMTFYTKGITGYVGVNDVVKAMVSLMKAPIQNENFILVAENLSVKSFQEKMCRALESKLPSKEAKPWLLGVAWRLDWLSHKLLGKRRQLSKRLAETSSKTSLYSSQKIKDALDFRFEDLDVVIQHNAAWFKRTKI